MGEEGGGWGQFFLHTLAYLSSTPFSSSTIGPSFCQLSVLSASREHRPPVDKSAFSLALLWVISTVLYGRRPPIFSKGSQFAFNSPRFLFISSTFFCFSIFLSLSAHSPSLHPLSNVREYFKELSLVYPPLVRL